MSAVHTRHRGAFTFIATLTLTTAAALAGSEYDLTAGRTTGGGGVSTGGDFEVAGATGEPATAPATGGDFSLTGGSGLVPPPPADPVPPCPADLDGSGDVGFGDILALFGQWGPCPAPCGLDLSGNGAVDFADLLMVMSSWGPCS